MRVCGYSSCPPSDPLPLRICRWSLVQVIKRDGVNRTRRCCLPDLLTHLVIWVIVIFEGFFAMKPEDGRCSKHALPIALTARQINHNPHENAPSCHGVSR